MDPNQAENTENAAAELPEGVRGWNWGAFLLGFIWALGNRVWSVAALWIGLLITNYLVLLKVQDSLVNTVDIVFTVIFGVISIVLGVKGNEWAWHDRKWDSVERFRKTQRNWTKWGVIIAIGSLVIGLVLGMTGVLGKVQ